MTRQQIIDTISTGQQNQKNIFTVDAFDFINYKKLKISDNRIETVQMPTILNLSRPEIGLHELTCKQNEKIR